MSFIWAVLGTTLFFMYVLFLAVSEGPREYLPWASYPPCPLQQRRALRPFGVVLKAAWMRRWWVQAPAQEPLRWDMVYLVEPAAWEQIVHRSRKTTTFDATS